MKSICIFCVLVLVSSLLLVNVDDSKKDEKVDKKDLGIVIGIDFGIMYLW